MEKDGLSNIRFITVEIEKNAFRRKNIKAYFHS